MDQLNSPVEQVVEPSNVLDIDTYFDEMYLTESEKEERKELAKNMFLILSAILTIIKANQMLKNSHDVDYYKEYVSDSLESLFKGVFGSDKYQSQIKTFADEFIDSTMRHINESYFTSEDRATVNAEQQSNSVYNSEQYERAIADGRTKKRWVTMHDKRVRKTHDEADGQEVDIKKPFEVGDSELLFPCDLSLGAHLKEICNCRCVVVYSGNKNELTDDEEKAVTDYLSPSSLEFNELMRTKQPLDSAQQQWKENLESALTKMPKYQGTVYRYINVNDSSAFANTYKQGDIICFNQFLSTSKIEGLYGDETTHNVEFIIMNGKNGADISKYNSSEKEVLYDYSQRFAILKAELNNGIATIYMKEV